MTMILQTQSTSIRPLTTAHLAQTMTLLELNGEELRQKIEAELASNPALEQVDEFRCLSCGRALIKSDYCPICSRQATLSPEEPIVFVSPYTDYSEYGKSTHLEEFSADDWQSSAEDLPTFVLRQIALELPTEDRAIAAHILTSLDEDGLMRLPHLEIARYHHVPLSRIENVVRIIQHAEPVGVGSATPQEALLVQLEVLAETQTIHPLARQAIIERMDLLSRRAFNELARVLGVSVDEIQRMVEFISNNLNPYPARAHWGDIHHGAEQNRLFLTPDIIISRLNTDMSSPLVVEVLSPYAGSLRVNPLFREIVNQAPPDKADSWQAAMDHASLLVKCIQQRNHTMMRLMETLVTIQRRFILEGDAHLKPITRAWIADKLEVHESTVSRAVAGKAVQLPNKRIILLDKFFDRSLQIRTALREIIAQETRPMSDTEIANKLAKIGHPVARRTVAKYRSMEGILPARFRQPTTAQPGS